MKKEDLQLIKKGIVFFDETTQNTVGVKLSEFYLTIRINEREYFFTKERGEYDGHADIIEYTKTDILPIISKEELIFSDQG
jgi:hypothetical protein